jgi:hypothetical protein
MIVMTEDSYLKEMICIVLQKRENPRAGWEGNPGVFSSKIKAGSVLLSQKANQLVPSALEGLTSVFGMETGVAPPPRPPAFSSSFKSMQGYGNRPL